MLFDAAADIIIHEAMQKYASMHIENEPQSMRILIHAPKISGITLMPPIILDVGMINVAGHTYALLLGWYTWEIPEDNLPDVLSKLLSLEEYLNEQYSDLEDENEDDEEDD